MGRQSLRSPFPITARSSSIMADTTHNQKLSPPMSSHEFMSSDRSRKAQKILGDPNASPQQLRDREGSITSSQSRGFDQYSQASSLLEPESAAPLTSHHHELRVRASSPLLGRNYHSAQHSSKTHQSPELPRLRQSESWSDLRPSPKADSYSFDTQSQKSLAYGVVEDMRGIRFPHMGPNPKDTAQTKPEPSKETKKKTRPSRIDLSLLFPKPKSTAAPMLSPQRYTNSPSPVHSEISTTKKAAPTKLIKPRSRSNSKKQVHEDVIPEEPLPPMPKQSRKIMDWFDMPVEKSIRVDDVTAEEADDEDLSPKMVSQTVPETRVLQAPRNPKEINFSQQTSVRTSRRSSLVSRRNSQSVETHLSPHPTTPFSDRLRTSLQAWQSESDLHTKKSKGVLSKKSSSSTLTAFDLSKTSVLCLSSSEDEDDAEDHKEDDENYGESLLNRATPQRALRESVSTYDDFEPEICTAEAVIATRGHALTQLNRAQSKISTSSSDSRRTARRPSRSRNTSVSSHTRSSVSAKRQESRSSTRVPLIEEQEELPDMHGGNTQLRPVPAYNNMHSAKRRSRIIAVTRQEESLLEAMRQRNGRFTPSIYRDITSTPNTDSDTDSNVRSVPPAPRIQEPLDSDYDTSFLRLSTAMFPSPGTASSTAGEGATSKDKEAFMSLSSTSDSEQRTDSNSTASPRLSLAYSETHSSSSTAGYTSPMTPTLPIHRFSPRAPPPSHAPPPIPPEAAKRHSRRRTDSSEAIVLDESANDKEPEVEFPLWAIKWARDSVDLAVVH